MAIDTEATEHGRILFHDIGDYLNRTEKLDTVAEYRSIKGIPGWQTIVPDQHGDWLNQRDDSFGNHIVMGGKGKNAERLALFENYSRGVESNRDAWIFNSSTNKLEGNIRITIDFYNDQTKRVQLLQNEQSPLSKVELEALLETDLSKISWNRSLRADAARAVPYHYNPDQITTALYRPYTKTNAYYAPGLNAYLNQIPRIFPTAEAKNYAMNISCVDGSFSVLLSDALPSKFVGESVAQWFPLHLYDELAADKSAGDLFAEPCKPTGLQRRDAITDEGLAYFQESYPNETLTKEDLFFYVYGLLHSEDYRSRFADNLSKELPRIPKVKKAADFWAFSKAGRDLAALHLNYETVDKYPVTIQAKGSLVDEDYRVTKMKFGKKRCEETGRNINDRSTVIYNGKITMTGIPDEAWDYVVNGKSALDWVMERQAVTTHKASGIVNDANDWAIETMGNAKYPLELFQRVVTVSLETQKIVSSLPELDMVQG